MHIEDGHWVIANPLYPAPDGFHSRVVLSGLETAIALTEPVMLPPIVRWCLDTYGSSGWTFDYKSRHDDPANPLNMIFYFASHDDALGLYLRWA